MKWRGSADKQLVDAVVASFREPAERTLERLSWFRQREWVRTYHWLDASGMALYFLDQLEILQIERALPARTLERLLQNQADNRRRSAALFAEFVELNDAFQQAGIDYANLKGFTLSPDSCPDPALRCQLDLDFLVDGRQLRLCQAILSRTGYKLVAATETVWEFKAGGSEITRMEDHYKPVPQRSVELHFAPSEDIARRPGRDPRLDRLCMRTWRGVSFPALADADLFVAQAVHLLGHLRGAHTRLAWLLEFKRHISVRHFDVDFWEEVRRSAQTNPDAPIAIGLTAHLAFQILGGHPPRELQWAVEQLPTAVKLWADGYGRQAVLADFPGTKLYLLLENELASDAHAWQRRKRASLLPLHRAPRIAHAGADDTLAKRLRRGSYQARFTLFRVRFHLVHGAGYLVELLRWRWRLRTVRTQAPDAVAEAPLRTRVESR